jgi:hypothetical protein
MTTYTLWHVLMASPTEPIPVKKRRYYIGLMRVALENCKTKTTEADRKVLFSAVDLLNTLCDMKLIEDNEKALEDAMVALMQDSLNDIEVRMFEGVLEDYEMVMESLPERTMITAHRATEKRLGKHGVAA